MSLSLKNAFYILVLIFACIAFSGCADESYEESITPDDSVDANFVANELMTLDSKYLFLEEFYNENGEKEFKEPYHYHISVFKLLAIRRLKTEGDFPLQISIPSRDCNFTSLQCTIENEIFSCGVISTAMGCFYENDLTTYFQFPTEFSINIESGVVTVKDNKSASYAVFKTYTSKEELPSYREPRRINERPLNFLDSYCPNNSCYPNAPD